MRRQTDTWTDRLLCPSGGSAREINKTSALVGTVRLLRDHSLILELVPSRPR